MLITIEGIDGSGKTTVTGALAERYPEAVLTQEPTDSWYGNAVRRSIEDDAADPLAELFLYTADHAAHLSRTIRPALADGAVVISDRYTDSRYAYQAVSIEPVVDQPLAFVQSVHEPWTRPPDATVYLDVDPETGADRSGVTNKFEEAAFLERVRENYERLLEDEAERFVRIDASQPIATVVTEAEEAVEQVIQDA